MRRCISLPLVGILLTMTGCPAIENAGVEHNNVCIDLSPDGKTVVFSSADGDLYLFDIASKLAARLTATDRTEGHPSFSPDGTHVAFSAHADERAPSHVFVLNLSDLTTTQITQDPERSDILPRFRPDGEHIIFARAYRHRPYSLGGWTWDKWDVCEVAADGGGLSRLTTENYYQLGRIVPRADGSLIYAADTMGNADEPRAALYSVSPGRPPTRLIPKAGPIDASVNAWASDPMIGPDDTSIVYCSDRTKPFWYDICVQAEDGQCSCLVGDKSRYNRYPDFFPDRQRILFLAGMHFNAGNRPIYSLWQVTLEGQTKEIAPSTLFTSPNRWLAEEGAER